MLNKIQVALFIAICFLSFYSNVQAQVSGTGIFFQAIARDSYSNPAKDRVVYVESSIIQSTATGTKVLIEIHKTKTDGTGVFSISVGNGTRIGGMVASLNYVEWAKGPYFLGLKIAIQPLSPVQNWDYSKELIDLGASPFGTVPYALYSGSSGALGDKLSISDTAKMLSFYAKSQTVKNLVTEIGKKLSSNDTASMLAPYRDVVNAIVASNITSLTAATVNNALDSKVNLADSLTIYVTPSQLAAKTFDSTTLYFELGLKANTSSMTVALATKEDIANKSINVTTDALSDTKYPSVKAIKTYVDSQITNSSIPDADGNTKGKIQIAGDLTGSASAPVIANNAITNAKIATGIDAAKISGDIPGKASNITGNLAIANGGTGATSAAGARTNLGLVIGTDVQAPLSFTAPIVKNGNSVTINQATPSVDGYLSASDFTSFSNKINATEKATNNGVATLGNDGKIPSNQIPAISFQSAVVVNSESEMLALSNVVVGSIAIRTDENRNYVLSATPASTLSNWVRLAVPTSVTSVNGATGPNVVLTTNDIAEGSNNKYYTDTRVRGALSAVSPLIFNTSSGTFSMSVASASSNGYLSSTDFSAFNNKQNAISAGVDYLAPNGSAALLTNFPTLNQSTTGNAETATKFATARNINGVAFDGSADITITANASTLTGTSLPNTVTGSSLTSVGTITAGVWSGTTITLAKGGTGATTAAAALTNLGAEASSNKSTSTDLGNTNPSDILYPSQKAVKAYVDQQSANAGVADLSITNAKLAGSITADKLVGTDINTVGTITTGVWSGTSIAIEKGGTGATTAVAARTNLGLIIGTNVMAANATTTLTGDVAGSGNGSFSTTVNSVGGVSSATIATLPNLVNTNTSNITSEITRATNAENALDTRIASNTSSITSNTSSLATINTTLGTKANLASPAFTGVPTAPTPASSDNSSKIATTEFVKTNLGTVSAGTLTGTTLASTITGSSLASVGTITSGTWSGSVIGNNVGGAGSVNGLLKANGTGVVSAAVAGTDYQTPLTVAPSIGQFLTSAAGGTYTWTAASSVTGVPYTGATGAVDLGAYDLKVNGLTIGLGNNSVSTNLAFGLNALKSNNSASGQNTAIGYEALTANTASQNNTALGYRALYTFNDTHSPIGYGNNTAIGSNALNKSSANSAYNTAIGSSAVYNNTTGSYNVGIGPSSLVNNSTGGDNISIGFYSGSKYGSGTGASLSNISRGILIGSDARTLTNNSTNEIAIGYNVLGNGSNTVTIGNASNTATYFTGDINLTGNVKGGTWSGTAIGSNYGGAGSVNGLMKANGSGVVSAAIAGADYQVPLIAGTSYIVPNAAITGATKTKLTYDAKGLVTSGADATTADIAPSNNRNYVTDAQAGVLSNTSGINTGDQTITLTGDISGFGTGTFATTINSVGGVSSTTIATIPTSITNNTNSIATINSTLGTKADIASPSFTGTPTAPTAATSDNSTTLATTAYVKASITASNAGLSSIGAISGISNANGATISGSTQLILTPADANFGGVVTTETQTFAGAKTFSNTATFNTDISVNGMTLGRGKSGNIYNTGFGIEALSAVDISTSQGTGLTSMGYRTLKSNTTGFDNTAIGKLALYYNTTGGGNAAFGSTALYSNTKGSNNTAIGNNALYNNNYGNWNTAVGYNSLNQTTSSSQTVVDGYKNTAIGYNSGFTNTTGANNTFVGYYADAASATLTNATAIGNGAIVNASNTVQIGNYSVTSVVTNGVISATGFTGNWSGSVIGSNVGGAGTVNGLLKANGSGVVSAAVAGSDYQAPLEVAPSSGQFLTSAAGGTYTWTSASSVSGVPYSGATGSVNLGSNSIIALNAKLTNDVYSVPGLLDQVYDISSNRDNNGFLIHTYNQSAVGSFVNIVATGKKTGNWGSNLTFLTRGGAYTDDPTEKMRITSSGKVGIGTITPTTTLDVNGTANFTGNITVGGTISSGTWSGSTIGVAYGGTGLTSPGAAGNVLTSNGTSWVSSAGGSGVNTLTYTATSYANGGTISGTTLTLSAADATNPGLVSTESQTFAGAKTFSGTTTFNADIVLNGIKIGRGNGSIGSNLAVGVSTLNTNTLSPNNTAIGYNALKAYSNQSSTSGYGGNTAVGSGALASATTGNQNTAIGNDALTSNTTGGANVAVGVQALRYVTSGLGNVGVGASVLNSTNTGYDNAALGNSALGTNTTGNKLTAIGNNADVATNNLTNATAIGYGATVSASNSIQLGNTSVTNIKTSGTLTAGAVTYPKLAGTAGQVLTDNGSGTLYWSSAVGSLGTFTTTSYANGGTISGTTLTLSAADATNPGMVTTGVQTFVGAKTFSTTEIVVSAGSAYNNHNSGRGMFLKPSLKSNGAYTDLVALDIQPTFNQNNYSPDMIGVRVQGANIVATGSGNDATNTAIGLLSLQSNTLTSSGSNTAIGYGTLFLSTTAKNNTALGTSALTYTTSGSSNTAIGANALMYNLVDNNTAIGNNALKKAASATNNIAVGKDAGSHYGSNANDDYTATSGTGNIFIGRDVRPLTNADSYEVVIGSSSGTGTIGDGSNTTTIGAPNTTSVKMYGSSWRNSEATAATNNNAIDLTIKAQDANVSGPSGQTANPGGNINLIPGLATGSGIVGKVIVNGKIKIIDGNQAFGKVLTSDASGLATWSPITAISSIGTYTTTSYANGGTISGTTLILSAADATNPGLISTGSQTFTGSKSFDSDIRVKNISIGNGYSGHYSNIAIGDGVLVNNTSGIVNTVVGLNALNANTSGSSNIAIGESTLNANTTGTSNIAIGVGSLNANNIGSSNTSIGDNALKFNLSSFNTAVGYLALHNNTSGQSNTALGTQALNKNTTGSNNVGIGFNAGPSNNNDVPNKSIFIGYNANAKSGVSSTNEIVIGSESSGLGSNTISIGNASTIKSQIYGALTVMPNTAETSTDGSSSVISAQNAGTGGTNVGGSVSINAGNGNSTGNGGDITLTPGTSSLSTNAGSVIINGKLKIVDGTQSINKVLTSDANGLTSWQNPLPSVQYATLATESDHQSISLTGDGSTTDKYLNTYITLPPGKWDVNLSILSSPSSSGTATRGSWWIRMGFSTSSSSLINTKSTAQNPTDFPVNNLVSGRVVASKSSYDLIQGHIIINNTSGSAKTYYLWTSQCDLHGADGSSTLEKLSSSVFGENLIFATPIY